MRIFHCHHCGHYLRYGTGRCTRCFQPTPLVNRITFAISSVVVGFVAVGSFVFSMLS